MLFSYGLYFFGGDSVIVDLWVKIFEYGLINIEDIDSNVDWSLNVIFAFGCLSLCLCLWSTYVELNERALCLKYREKSNDTPRR
jgi:hypothetical protein